MFRRYSSRHTVALAIDALSVRARIGIATGALAGLSVAGLVAAVPASASTATFTISGTASCGSGDMEGVWVDSTGGGSWWANWSGNNKVSSSSYNLKFTAALPTEISLHVGCGGSKSSWSSDNYTPFSYGISPTSGSTVTLNAVSCNSPAGTCTWVNAENAYNWAMGELSGSPCVTSPNVGSWYGGCLALVNDAYYYGLGGGQYPNPTVYGKDSYAIDEWYCYSGQKSKITDTVIYYGSCPSSSLIQTSWQINSGSDPNPPRGAIVFYPSLDHVTISVGNGYVISADEKLSGGCYVHEVRYNSFSGYAGWALPYNANGMT